LKQIIKNTLRILNKGERKRLILLSLSDVVINLLDLLFLAALLYLVHYYSEPATSSAALFSGSWIQGHPLLPLGIFLFLFALKNAAGFLLNKYQYHFVYRVASRISKDNLLQFLRGSYHDYVHTDSSVNIQKISQQPIEFSHYVLLGLQQLFSQAVMIVFTIAAVLFYKIQLFPLLALSLLPPVFIVASLVKNKLRSVRIHGKSTGEKSKQHLQEALAGFVESNIHRQHDFFSNRYFNVQSKLNHFLAEKLAIQSMPSRLIEVFALFGLFMLILVNAYNSGSYSLDLITIGAFMAAAYKIIPGIVKLMNTVSQLKTYEFTMDGLQDKRPMVAKQSESAGPAIDSIRFEKVAFRFPSKKILESFSMELEKGDFAAITGDSGKGKSTIANLLLGFLKPTSGNICINGKVCDSNERKRYWNRLTYIKQQPFFVHESIKQNITLAEEGSDAIRLNSVVATAGLDKMLNGHEQGLRKMVTENGKNFSGGQRQRIVLARALYKDFDLIILDEPFNELDEPAEKQMLEQLKQISKQGKIVILITHNRSALSFCNKHFSLDE
jgi:ABC-type multidrug transport system fused ATPase/permease subunit